MLNTLADEKWLLLVHPQKHIDRVRHVCEIGGGVLDQGAFHLEGSDAIAGALEHVEEAHGTLRLTNVRSSR